MTEVTIKRQHGKWILEPSTIILDEATAGLENVGILKLINDTDFKISDVNIKSTRSDCVFEHIALIMPHQSAQTSITFSCPEEEDGPVNIGLKIMATGRRISFE